MKQKDEDYSESLDPNIFVVQNLLENLTCTICNLIPNPSIAIEEPDCGHLFCPKCIFKWKAQHQTCPFCRSNNISKNLRDVRFQNKFLYNYMNSLILKCPYKCPWSGKWEDLNKHLNSCENYETPCKYFYLGCTYRGKGEQKKYHENNQDSLHFKLSIKFIEDNKLGPEKNGKEKYQLFYKYKASVHQHFLTFLGTERDNGWSCDGRNSFGGCKSGFVGFGQTKGVKRFRCNQCDFDLCLKCMNAYLEN